MSHERRPVSEEPPTYRIIIAPHEVPDHDAFIAGLGDELPRFTSTLIAGLARDDTMWTPQIRSNILQQLPFIPFETLEQKALRDTYLQAVQTQDEKANPLGTVNDLLVGGKILAPHFPTTRTTYSAVTKTWEDLAQKIKHKPDWQTVGMQYLDLEQTIRPASSAAYSFREILDYHQQGLASLTIASRLEISVSQVKTVVTRLKQLGFITREKRNTWGERTYIV